MLSTNRNHSKFPRSLGDVCSRGSINGGNGEQNISSMRSKGDDVKVYPNNSQGSTWKIVLLSLSVVALMGFLSLENSDSAPTYLRFQHGPAIGLYGKRAYIYINIVTSFTKIFKYGMNATTAYI
jgi:hypothetical protein